MAEQVDPVQMQQFLADRKLSVSDFTKKAATIDRSERDRLRQLAIEKRVSRASSGPER